MADRVPGAVRFFFCGFCGDQGMAVWVSLLSS